MKFSRTQREKLRKLFKSKSAIKIVYFFGSRARGDNGAQSDYDFALYIDPKKSTQAFDLLLDIAGRIPLILGTDKVDVIVLNSVDNLILKHSVITAGAVIYEVPGFKLNFELSTLGEYRDFRLLEKKYYPD